MAFEIAQNIFHHPKLNLDGAPIDLRSRVIVNSRMALHPGQEVAYLKIDLLNGSIVADLNRAAPSLNGIAVEGEKFNIHRTQ